MTLDAFLTLVLIASCWLAVRGEDDRFRAMFAAAETGDRP